MSRFVMWLLLPVAMALGCVSPAKAQISVVFQTGVAPQLGEIIAGTVPTTFRIAPSGQVTRVSGDAIRLSTAPVAVPRMMISCRALNLSNLCLIRYVRITIVPQTQHAASRITMFYPGQLAGASFRNGPPPAGSSLDFQLNPMGVGDTTLSLAMDVVVEPGYTGPATFAYNVGVAFD